MTHREKNRRLCQRMDGHMQKGCKVSDRSTQAEGKANDAHVLNRGIGEEPLDITLTPKKQSRKRHGNESKTHEHLRRQRRAQRSFYENLATYDCVQSDVQ